MYTGCIQRFEERRWPPPPADNSTTNRYYDCPVHGTYQELRDNNGTYSFVPLASGQVAIFRDTRRPSPEARGITICTVCGSDLKSRSIVDYATGQEDRRHECGPKCMAATGPNCECRCKGANHGA